jgi:hypothetical protein
MSLVCPFSPKTRPVASTGVSASIPPTDIFSHEEGEDPNQARATAALQDAFARLAPQGSDAWNFLAAFTHLGDRYGPYQPGASALSELLGRAEPVSGGPIGRLRGKGGRNRGTEVERGELEEAMAQVVEAFRFLSARVQTLEERLARQDRPVEGAAWLAPAADLDDLVQPVAAHVRQTTPGGLVVHGDCGSGALLDALSAAGIEAEGVEPRGAVALGALERGCSVAIRELAEDLAGRPDGALGGLVFSGVVDRMPLHSLLALLTHSRRVLALGAPLVVVLSDAGMAERHWDGASLDLLEGRPLRTDTWTALLDRAGFVDVGPLPSTRDRQRRTVLVACAPS